VARILTAANLHNRPQEHLWIIALDSSNNIVGIFEGGRGSVGSAAFSPRTIIQPLLTVNASAAILAHNHPSGNLKPSDSDIETTKELNEFLKVVDIMLLDHVIISRNGYKSLKVGGLF